MCCIRHDMNFISKAAVLNPYLVCLILKKQTFNFVRNLCVPVTMYYVKLCLLVTLLALFCAMMVLYDFEKVISKYLSSILLCIIP